MDASAPPNVSSAAMWSGAKCQAVPAFLVDIAAGRLLDCNDGGRQVWAGDGGHVVLPQPLDAAMPALQVLRAAQVGPRTNRPMLCWWTPRGVLARRGTVLRIVDGDVVAVVLDDTSGPVATPGLPQAPAPFAVNAKLAHELRTPIGAVAAYAEVLAGEHFGPLGNARYRDYARNVRESALHALGVIEGMLGAAADEGRQRRELRFRDVDPADVIQSCMTVMTPIAEAASVTLRASVPRQLPRIIADEVSLRQMLLNLLTNAIKFARTGDRVSLGVAYSDDGTLSFAVDDTGPGLAATRYPGEDTSKGLGLGLPLTRELAEANGAALAIESAPGHGTRARISFSHTRVVV